MREKDNEDKVIIIMRNNIVFTKTHRHGFGSYALAMVSFFEANLLASTSRGNKSAALNW